MLEMTVQQLIDKLMAVKEKDKLVTVPEKWDGYLSNFIMVEEDEEAVYIYGE